MGGWVDGFIILNNLRDGVDFFHEMMILMKLWLSSETYNIHGWVQNRQAFKKHSRHYQTNSAKKKCYVLQQSCALKHKH